MNQRERICALLLLPIHVLLMPLLAGWLMGRGILSEINANVLVYGAAAVYVLAFEFRFLRREFDTLCDRLLYCLVQIAVCYCFMLAFNLLLSGILTAGTALLGLDSDILENQNNTAIMDMADTSYGKVAALSMYLAPIVEEIIFRAGIFGAARKKNRILAYALSMGLFAVYHVWQFAVADPWYWLYAIIYLPASFALCLCYERTSSIWASMGLHALINSLSMTALKALEGMM